LIPQQQRKRAPVRRKLGNQIAPFSEVSIFALQAGAVTNCKGDFADIFTGWNNPTEEEEAELKSAFQS
ncbi:MAG: hypothetical protein COC23_03485, partial [Hyphomicrobiales bacterium]